MRMTRLTTIAVMVLGGAMAALGQDVSVEQQKLLAKRAAEADAYRKLAETVYGLQINSQTYVQDFVAESDDIRGEVDTFVKGIRLGTPTWYDDGSCEVPAEVTVAKVVETLRTAHSHYYHGDHVKSTDFESMERRIEKNIIKVIGMGAPREDLPPDLPEGVVELLGDAPTGLRPPVPEIWRAIGAQARLSALRAARMDAMRRLAERIKGLRLTSRTQVRDFVAESDTITTEMLTHLIGAEETGSYLHYDELIAEVQVRVPTEQVISTIKQLHTRYYRGDDVSGTDIERVTRAVIKKDFEATGMGIPNPRFIRKYAETSGLVMPDWSLRSLEVEGTGTDEQMDTAQGKLRAARAAEMDARRKLAEQIAGLHIRSETIVRDFVAEHDYLSVQVDAVVVDAVVTNTRFADETAIVTIALPGACVWDVLNDELHREAR